MIEDDNQFLEITALGSELAWRVMKLWMQSAGRTLNNYQAMSVHWEDTLPTFEWNINLQILKQGLDKTVQKQLLLLKCLEICSKQ